MEHMNDSNTLLVFCGKILYQHPAGGGVNIVLDNTNVKIHISSEKDQGLAFLPEGKKRHFVVKDGKILAVYTRPRIKLLKAVGAGREITGSFLKSLRPTYPKFSRFPCTTFRWKGTFEEWLSKDPDYQRAVGTLGRVYRSPY